MSTNLTVGRVTPAPSLSDEQHSLPRTASSIAARTDAAWAVEIQKAAHREARISRLLNAAATLLAAPQRMSGDGVYSVTGAVDTAMALETILTERLSK